ncbi:hypothetical protein ACIP2X_29690 [Streptomyces sp. NPDC089424]|uniref:hypothetical protein n=1 Tax=Streptomyces sp. NPDC089424 TaxID=3365917 RepID=UPI0038101795
MRERPEVVQESSTGEEKERRRIDLSVPQVAGGAVAAVVAAKLASYFGVYGTILGAGLVSVVATCGGSLFQHFFTRTGEQLRDTRVPAPTAEQAPRAPGEFSAGTVHRARVRGPKRPLLAAALVFGVTMAGITTFELASGSSFSGKGDTTVGDALSRQGGSSPDSGDPETPEGSGGSGDSDSGSVGGGFTPAPSTTPGTPEGATPSDGASSGGDNGGTAGDATAEPGPGGSEEGEQGTGEEPAATPTPSAPATDPAPSASSRSGSGDPDPADPAAP